MDAELHSLAAPSAIETGPSRRRAALLLHSIVPADRQWLLDRLPPAQRSAIQALLDELTALGLPVDSELVRSALAEPAAVPLDDTTALRAASGQRIAQLLVDEPDRLIARVLRCGPWPWQEAVLIHIGASRRRRVVEHLGPVAANEAFQRKPLDQALLRTLLERSRALDGGAGSPSDDAVQRPGLGGALRRMAGWAREAASIDGARA